MPKGLFTGCTVALFEAAPSLDALEQALAPFGLRGRGGDGKENVWLGGAGVLLGMGEGTDGVVTVDVVEAAWPDAMGHPEEQPELFGAWTLGALGPFTFPGALERAVEHALEWPEAKETASRHRAFVRVRSSYVLGKDGDAPVLPEGYDPMQELFLLTAIARSLLDLPGALAFFAPSGEIVMDRGRLDHSMVFHQEQELPPFDAWSGVRFFEVGDEDGWAMMDTVGMGQLDVLDQEACFPTDRVDPNEVATFLRNVSLYLLANGNVVEEGHGIEGPGGIWRAYLCEQSLAPAPRPTLRWLPTFVEQVPKGFVPPPKEPAS